MKYDGQLSEASKSLSNAAEVLIVLPKEPTVDELASGLALFLALEQANKKASIVTEGVIRVGHTNLFGVGQIQSKLPQIGGDNLIISLGGVVAEDGTVPSLQKLDWYPQGTDLNLVFHVLPGQKFQPTHITPKLEGGGFGVIFSLGAGNVEDLGSIYNQEVFSKAHVVNIDNQTNNANFGNSNIIDADATSLSEMIWQILPGLQLPVNNDIASNILAGIFTATDNLQSQNINAETFATIAAAMQAGGQKPAITITEVVSKEAGTSITENNIPETPKVDYSQFFPSQPQPEETVTPMPSDTPQAENFTVPPVVNNTADETVNIPSPEENPTGEEVVTPESDWLTPKIFKGSSIG